MHHCIYVGMCSLNKHELGDIIAFCLVSVYLRNMTMKVEVSGCACCGLQMFVSVACSSLKPGCVTEVKQ